MSRIMSVLGVAVLLNFISDHLDVDGTIIGPFRAWKPPLCHKEPARSKQNIPLGVLCVSKPLPGGFGCDELVLYGIRELAPATLSTNESQASTFLDQ